ncbi:pyridoxal-phosphate dependent enzyme [Aliiglaciecola sp. LCG003]|uniref:1-aminocyclopropane-1-carboxylate deaminase/D-cysteine desulfhydrase n=1 Tax=Aliiglaciecola sp. LCG003 TaxID=3053655 RepID=UPI00257368A3|nr:pyridoxal-phosphate dependent enzyme [Aliiglaciecola sp. LCG003]WJG08684.1 pyridoxal-phosphate dependent enzyme [Aliiglaciecola sp. LCG003]
MSTGELSRLQRTLGISLPSAEVAISPAWHNEQHVRLWVKRDDLIHPIISGNKWRKLGLALQQIMQQKPCQIISFGGGYSNHLHALAYCCQQLQLPLRCIVRGDYSKNMTPMLTDIQQWGAKIEFVDKLTYSKRNDEDYLNRIKQQFDNPVIIPEGGSQQQALHGSAEIINELQQSYDYIVTPVASGGTMAGLVHGIDLIAQVSSKILGIAVLKGQDYLEHLVKDLLPEAQNRSLSAQWQILHDYHCGGYAKKTPELISFCEDFYQDTHIKVEPVYSGKLFFALKQMIEQGYFPANSKILAIHTGGMQGNRN